MTGATSLVFSSEQIQEQVAGVGARITSDYRGRAPLLLCVLDGAIMFAADLCREIAGPVDVSFMAVSKYEPGNAGLPPGGPSGRVRVLLDIDVDLEGRDVILVEDLVDTGLTAQFLLSDLRRRSPASLELCTLLDRSVRRIVPLKPRYAALDCPDGFMIGYGLDHRGRYRNLRAIHKVEDMDALRADPDALERLLRAV